MPDRGTKLPAGETGGGEVGENPQRTLEDLLNALEALIDGIERMPEATRDTEAVVRIELANVLARAEVLLRALVADGTE